MKTVITNGTGRAASIGKPAAGKTGTTDDNKDAYFMGYTPNIVTGVWVGNDKNKAHHKITGGTVPALIWKEFMKGALASLPYSTFNYPEIVLDKSNLPPAIELQATEEVVGSGALPDNPNKIIDDIETQEIPALQKQMEDANYENLPAGGTPAPLKAPLPSPIVPTSNIPATQ